MSLDRGDRVEGGHDGLVVVAWLAGDVEGDQRGLPFARASTD
jgi:hypothetical protein